MNHTLNCTNTALFWQEAYIGTQNEIFQAHCILKTKKISNSLQHKLNVEVYARKSVGLPIQCRLHVSIGKVLYRKTCLS